MADRKRIQLKPGKAKSIQRGHPWIFSGAISSDTLDLQEGEIVSVVNQKGTVLATGFYGEGSIAVRILAFEEVAINKEWYFTQLSNALKTREIIGIASSERTNCYRLIHGEGDQIPGLVIDIYDDLAVIQAHHRGIEMHLEYITEALKEIYQDKIHSTLFKTTYKKSELESDSNPVRVVKENDISFKINAQTGQKTGFFLDQRDNRALVEQFAKDRKVLNTYSYSGGFTMYALRASASEVHSLDSSQKAIDLLEENLDINGFDKEKHRSICGDAIKYLISEEALEEHYDIIILDPPAFAKSRGARHRAVQAYKRINSRAMKIIQPGGLLFTFSCSQVVTTELFDNTVAAAAIEIGRKAKILKRLHQPADHPVNIYHPEGNYLKGLLLQID
jgi:23S rRNA (cytosine1962-C5)-methyltransferase